VGDARSFERGRDLAAWLGLVPRQVTTEQRCQDCALRTRASVVHVRRGMAVGPTGAQPSKHGRRRAGGKDGANRLGAAPS
jgi:transposase